MLVPACSFKAENAPAPRQWLTRAAQLALSWLNACAGHSAVYSQVTPRLSLRITLPLIAPYSLPDAVLANAVTGATGERILTQ